MADTLRASAKVSVAVMGSRILGVVRDSLFSALFKPGWLTDAYIVAFRIPNLLRDLFAEGALSSAFVPTFSDAMVKGGKERAFLLGNLVLTGVTLVTGLLALLGVVFAGEVVSAISGAAGGNPQALAVATEMARVMMPILTLVSVSAVLMGMLNAQKRFLAPAYAPALFNVVSIIGGVGLLLTGAGGQRAMLVWSLATVAAAVVQGACQLPSLYKLGFRPRLALAGLFSDPGVRRILRLMTPAVLGMAAVQVNVFVNTYFAEQLADGSSTYLNNAFRLFYLPIGVFGVALGTVTGARVADDAARGNRQALVDSTAEGTRAVALLASASAVGLVLLAEPVVQLLFQWGSFGADDTAMMVPIVRAYMLGVLPYSLIKVLAPSFYSLDRPRIPMVASLLAVATNLAFNAATYQILGARGLALGTTLAALVNLGVLRLSLARVVGPQAVSGFRMSPRNWGLLVVGNVVLAGTVLAFQAVRGSLLQALPSPFLAKPVGALWLFVTIGAGFSAYVFAMSRMGYPGASVLAQMPRRLWGRVSRREPS